MAVDYQNCEKHGPYGRLGYLGDGLFILKKNPYRDDVMLLQYAICNTKGSSYSGTHSDTETRHDRK